MVPEGWTSRKLGEISSYVTSGSRGWASYYSESGDVFVRITNLRRSSIYLDMSNTRYVALPNGSKEGLRTRLQQGDILVSITADLGIIGFIPNTPAVPHYINQHVALVRPDSDSVEPQYLAYQLASPKMRNVINRLNDAGAKAGLSLPTIRSIPVDLPSLPEQKKIAEILSTWDKAIETTEMLLANAEAQKKALMQQLLTGKRRLKGFEGEWREVPLRKILHKVIDYRGKAPPKSEIGIPLITARNVRSGHLSFGQREYIEANSYDDWMNRGLPQEGDILFTTEAPLGNVAMFPASGKYALGQRIITLRTNEAASPGYLFQFLLSSLGQQRILAKSSGSTALGIKSREFEKILVPLPSLAEQQTIADVLSTCDAEIEVDKKQLEALKVEKQALMQQLLTGKRRAL